MLFDNLQRYREAADEYTWVVDADIAKLKQGQKPGRWFAKALEDAVFAWEEVVKAAEAAEPKTAVAKSGQPLTVPPEQQGLLTACENYVQYLPKGDKEVEANYKAAEIYYKYNHFPEAVKLFAALVAGHPESSLAVPSANLILDSYNLTGDYQAVHDWAKRFLASPKLARGKTKEEGVPGQPAAHPRGVGLQAGRATGAQGRIRAGCRALRLLRHRVSKEHPRRSGPLERLHRLLQGGRIRPAIETRKRLIAEYPQEQVHAQGAVRRECKAGRRLSDFATAATLYERYAAWLPAADRRHQRRKTGKRGRGKAATQPPASTKSRRRRLRGQPGAGGADQRRGLSGGPEAVCRGAARPRPVPRALAAGRHGDEPRARRSSRRWRTSRRRWGSLGRD